MQGAALIARVSWTRNTKNFSNCKPPQVGGRPLFGQPPVNCRLVALWLKATFFHRSARFEGSNTSTARGHDHIPPKGAGADDLLDALACAAIGRRTGRSNWLRVRPQGAGFNSTTVEELGPRPFESAANPRHAFWRIEYRETPRIGWPWSRGRDCLAEMLRDVVECDAGEQAGKRAEE